jgi:hypothetical protein
MSLVKTAPMQVLFRGTYSAPGDADPIAYRSGKLVEHITVMDPVDGQIIDNLTLAETINGECVPGALLSLTLNWTAEKVPAGQRVVTKHKFRVVNVEDAA